VRRLVELHGGEVRAESGGKGAGSTFTVTLPAPARPAAIAEPDAGGDAADQPVRPSTLEGVRVLVVDDDSDFLDLAAMILRGAGAEVRTASAAFRAYEVVASWQPDVVLTDLAMPEEDGFMLRRALRTLFAERGMRVPIIALTAYGTPESGGLGAQAGFDLFITKPIDPLQLTSLVGELVGRAR
jgi:CheY-like chemotaxis protein